MDCNLHENANTRPGVSAASQGILNYLLKSNDEKLMAKYLLDSNNEFRLRHPFVIKALIDILMPKVLPELKKYEEECGDAHREDGCCGKRKSSK